MKKVDHYIFKYLVFSLPLVIIISIWASMTNVDQMMYSKGVIRVLWDSLGWVFILWILFSLYFVFKMVFSSAFRDQYLRKFTGMKERDEREDVISYRASRFTFLSSLALMLLFLFLSMFQVTVNRNLNKELKDDKNGSISLGMKFSPYEDGEERKGKELKDSEMVASYHQMPLTKEGLLILLILWHIGSYHYVAKKELRT